MYIPQEVESKYVFELVLNFVKMYASTPLQYICMFERNPVLSFKPHLYDGCSGTTKSSNSFVL